MRRRRREQRQRKASNRFVVRTVTNLAICQGGISKNPNAGTSDVLKGLKKKQQKTKQTKKNPTTTEDEESARSPVRARSPTTTPAAAVDTSAQLWNSSFHSSKAEEKHQRSSFAEFMNE